METLSKINSERGQRKRQLQDLKTKATTCRLPNEPICSCIITMQYCFYFHQIPWVKKIVTINQNKLY